MGNKNYWYLLSLQRFLEANSLKEALQNGYLIWILQIAQRIFSHRMHGIFAIIAIVRAVQVFLCWSSHSILLSYELWPTEHNAFKNPAGNYHWTSVLALQLARPTLGFPDRKQLAATQRNNVWFHLMDFNNVNVGVWFAHLARRSVACLLCNYNLYFSICILFF